MYFLLLSKMLLRLFFVSFRRRVLVCVCWGKGGKINLVLILKLMLGLLAKFFILI